MPGKNKEKKVGILTFHWADDFGAMLQAYGLKYALLEMGIEAEIIPYSNINLSGRYGLIKWVGTREQIYGKKGYWDKYITKKNLKNLIPFLKKKRAMRGFRHKYLTSKCIRKRELFLHLYKYDSIVIGSDQVWNPEITVGIDKYYFGNFKKKPDSKVIAYAASIGSERLNTNDSEMVGELLNKNFNVVSVRERSSIPYLQELYKKEIFDMPDPTLLCNLSAWEKVLIEPKINRKYVLIYSTEDNGKMFGFARELCSKEDAILINARELSIGPSEFLGLAKNAEYIVTNSFHCTVFSIIFHKNFYVFKHSNKNARLHDLLENVGLLDRISDSFDVGSLSDIQDWTSIDDRLITLKDRGTEFLKKYI